MRSIIPIATCEKILRKQGAERVSFGGSEALSKVLEEIAVKISKKAIDLARHTGRKTIKAKDIELDKEN